MNIISRKNAIENKLRHYFTGTPCLHGHIAKRTVDSCVCIDCKKITAGKKRLAAGCKPWYKTDAERKAGRTASLKKYAELNPEKVKAAQIAYKANNPENARRQ